jgi:hypothetical protein
VVARWAARALSIGLAGMVALFFVAEGGVNPLTLAPREAVLMFLMFTTCGAMVAAWRWERVAGAISLAAAIGFIVVEFAISGNLVKGPYFYLMMVPGALYLVASALSAPSWPAPHSGRNR